MTERRSLLALAAACALAGCGGDEAPSTDAVAQCLREGGASVERDPRIGGEPGSPGWEPSLTPGTVVEARGQLRSGSRFALHVAPEEQVDDAEDRALEYLKLFGFGRERLVRRDTALLLLASPRLPGAEDDLARRCMD